LSVEIKVLDLLDAEVEAYNLAGSEIKPGISDPLPYPAEAYLEVEVS
jgi:hypothetical protein